jgi:hypothetical protein
MKSASSSRRARSVELFCGLAGVALAALSAGGAAAQQAQSVALVRQDFSDCTNSNVSAGVEPGGTLSLVRNANGTTSVKVAMTVAPNTTYHFFLKCVTQLGDITTDTEGIGEALFNFQTNSVGNVFAFDMYPEGAPPGNKYQSVQVRFP